MNGRRGSSVLLIVDSSAKNGNDEGSELSTALLQCSKRAKLNTRLLNCYLPLEQPRLFRTACMTPLFASLAGGEERKVCRDYIQATNNYLIPLFGAITSIGSIMRGTLQWTQAFRRQGPMVQGERQPASVDPRRVEWHLCGAYLARL
jgi:hypothetical protein